MDWKDYHFTPDGQTVHYGTDNPEECNECLVVCPECDGFGSAGWHPTRHKVLTCPVCSGKGRILSEAPE